MTELTGQIEMVAFDGPDIDALARFYTALTGWPEVDRQPDWITLRADDGQRLAFQLAPDHVAPQWPSQEHPQQLHLDLFVDDKDEAARRAVELGATQLAVSTTWITLADPAGHPFDLCQRGAPDGSGVGLFAVTFDVPDGEAEALARFYGELLGWPTTYSGPGGAMIEADGRHVMFQQVRDFNRPQWPDPAHPQQGHLDIAVADLDTGQERALELGATSMNAGDTSWRVFTDPVGHPFCLVREG